MAVEGLMRVALYGDWAKLGRPWQVTWNYHMDSPGAWDNLAPQALIEAIKTAFETADLLETALSIGVRSNWLEVTRVDGQAFYPYGTGMVVVGAAGSGTDLLPEDSGPLLLFENASPTTLFPRPGRMYWPGISEGLQDSGAIAQSYVTILESVFEEVESFVWEDSAEDFTFTHVLVSNKTDPPSWEPVVRTRVSTQIARVKRRGRVQQGRS